MGAIPSEPDFLYARQNMIYNIISTSKNQLHLYLIISTKIKLLLKFKNDGKSHLVIIYLLLNQNMKKMDCMFYRKIPKDMSVVHSTNIS